MRPLGIPIRIVPVQSLDSTVQDVLDSLQTSTSHNPAMITIQSLPQDIRSKKPADILYLQLGPKEGYVTAKSYLDSQEPLIRLARLAAEQKTFYSVPPSWH